MNRYFNLLKSWCDRLIDLQIKEIKDRNFYGGILCPSCSLIHGRCADAVYPMIVMYDKTGDEKYYTAAKSVMEWAQYNVLRKNGGYFNDKTSVWNGTTVFFAIALGEVLLKYKSCIDKETYDKWYNAFFSCVDFVYECFDSPDFKSNINYMAAEAPAMAFAFLLSQEEKYKVKAYEKAYFMKDFFTPEGLLFGEGLRTTTKDKHCYYVDIGYNVEESLPALCLFAHLMNDKDFLEFCAEKYMIHIEFMLPDGAWDNSWGTRANKWTYWGSRTSDGVQTGVCYLTEISDVFAEVAQRNFELLEKCSKGGDLYGGLMYIDNNEDPCSHHSFCHAKALCTMIETNFEYKNKVSIPRDKEYGIKNFESTHVSLVAKDKWRATVSDTDAVYYPYASVSGGSLTMLYHMDMGVILSSCMAKYDMAEPQNMQISRNDDIMPNCTLRIVDGEYESVNDKLAMVSVEEFDNAIIVNAMGKLKNTDYIDNGNTYNITYCFKDGKVVLKAKTQRASKIVIPVIAYSDDTILIEENGVSIKRDNKKFSFKILSEFSAPEDKKFRNFSVIGGFSTYPITVELKENESVEIHIIVE